MSRNVCDDPWLGAERGVLSTDRVVAWRRWRLRPRESGEPLLYSAHEDCVWPDRTLLAECNPARTWGYRLVINDAADHRPPAEGCRCGIYAYRTPELARPMGPGVWVDGPVIMAGPMFATEAGYRGRMATIDGPLGLYLECIGGDDLYSPTRCFDVPTVIRFGGHAYYPVCASHPQAPVGVSVRGSFEPGRFSDMVAGLAHRLGTSVGSAASA